MILLSLAMMQIALQSPSVDHPNASLPAILIYWEPGMSYPTPPNEVIVAVWPDGRIVWRRPAEIWSKQRGEMTAGRYYKASVSPQQVQATLTYLDKNGLTSQDGGGLLTPDADNVFEVIRRRGRTTQLGFSERAYSTGPLARFHNAGLQMWLLVKERTLALVPKAGRPIPHPTPAEIRT